MVRSLADRTFQLRLREADGLAAAAVNKTAVAKQLRSYAAAAETAAAAAAFAAKEAARWDFNM